MSLKPEFAVPEDVEQWMSLVDLVADSFPGLDKEEYQTSLEACIQRREAICAKMEGQIVGVLLFSVEEGTLAFLAVHPAFRKRGIAVAMVECMVSHFPEGRDIWVTTFREDDPQGGAARALYLQYGFEPDEITEEMGYPCQKFVLRRP